MQPDDSNEIRRRLAVLEERIDSVQTEAKANHKTLEVSVAAALDRMRTDMYRAVIGGAVFVVALLSIFQFALKDSASPVIINYPYPPAAEQPAPAPAAPTQPAN